MKEEKTICQCGCGSECDKYTKNGNLRKFIHGHNKPSLGKKMKEETKLKISNTNKEKNISPPDSFKFEKGSSPWNKGTKGLTSRNRSSFKKGHTPKHSGRERPEYSGEKHWNWKNGITLEALKIRHSMEYKKWRTSVFERDSYTCQKCGIKNKKGLKKSITLEAHHIESFHKNHDKRFLIENGITLCRECHIKHHKENNE